MKRFIVARIFDGRNLSYEILCIIQCSTIFYNQNSCFRHRGLSQEVYSKMSSRRPRRSRIYDLNYNIGENYYKSAIDRLDEKYSSRPPTVLLRHSEPPAISPPRRPRFDVAAEDLESELELSRDRAARAIQKETLLDQRTGRKGLELEASFDGQVSFQNDKISLNLVIESSVFFLRKIRINI